jgi:hypothetical protein
VRVIVVIIIFRDMLRFGSISARAIVLIGTGEMAVFTEVHRMRFLGISHRHTHNLLYAWLRPAPGLPK